jgi:pimeloyl-ACP methyl ester carboxylesterase
VRKLALLDARLGAVPRERAERWRGARSGDAPPRHYASRAEAMAAFRLTPPEADVAPAIRAELAAHAIRQRADGRWMMAFDRAVLALDGSRLEDLLPIIARVRCPTLILRGRDSTVIGEAQSAALRTALPDAIQETVDGGHHFLLAHPDATAARLAAFLA